MNAPQVLTIFGWGATPPPVHGSAVMNVSTIEVLQEFGALDWHNSAASPTVSVVGSISVRKLLGGLRCMAGAAVSLARHRADIAYISPAIEGVALWRDILIWALASLRAQRVIAHLHSSNVSAFVGPRVFARASRILLRRTEVWVLTDACAAQVSARSVCVVPNGVTCSRCNGSLDDRGQSPVHVIFFSNLVRGKGVEIFIEVVKPFVRAGVVRVTIAGASGDVSVVRAADSFAQDNLLSVRRQGTLNEVERCELLRSADVLLLPTQLCEGQPLVIAEAMQHGVVPVVTSRGAPGGMARGTGVVADTPSQMSDALAEFIHDRLRLSLARARCAEVWSELFSGEVYSDRVRERLLGGDRS